MGGYYTLRPSEKGFRRPLINCLKINQISFYFEISIIKLTYSQPLHTLVWGKCAFCLALKWCLKFRQVCFLMLNQTVI
ncbi:hypothetical protein NEISUBOT_05314 [Neisseria subflava NJ9703]|uniref:Uncharacterized protein n=1 Tax=Neisseria subflava NJ9703 TaxID=546268 RepID=A0A9W5IPH5_NEISU|nr:hypothetical protein NEISUBOT_05314 [Neisseria subflava NJ9703]